MNKYVRYYDRNLTLCRPRSDAFIAVKTKIISSAISQGDLRIPIYTVNYAAWRIDSPEDINEFSNRRDLRAWLRDQIPEQCS